MTVSHLTELPTWMHSAIHAIAEGKGVDTDRILISAVSLYLLQNCTDQQIARMASRTYLKCEFSSALDPVAE
jgi:Protein of unknown function (DUF2811)